jgi:hypothetical protein
VLAVTDTEIPIVATFSMRPSASGLIYDALPDGHVRLLEIHPGRRDVPMEMSIRPVQLSDSPPYSALSYCWGGPTAKRMSVLCNGASVQITGSLFGALRTVRREDESRLLWADALCINQDDNDEKREQVMLMRDIYRRASRTVIWLGEDHSQSRRALNWARAGTSKKSFYLQQLPVVPFFKLLHRPWFRRIWIVQEVAVSGGQISILCGSSEPVPWASFVDGCNKIVQAQFGSYTGRLIGYPLMIEEARRKFSTKGTGDEGLEDLITTCSHYRRFEATDPRDKVYALRGLARGDALLDMIPVDYNIAVDDLYRRVARVSLQMSGNLQVLSVNSSGTSGRQSTGSPDLPSWMPDWRLTDDVGSYFTPPDQSAGPLPLRNFHATAHSVSKSVISDDGKLLRVSGLLVDRIKAVGKTCPEPRLRPKATYISPFDMMRFGCRVMTVFFEAEEMGEVGSGGRYEPSAEPLLDAFAKVIISGHVVANTDLDDDLAAFRDWHAGLTWFRVLHRLGAFRYGFISVVCLCVFAYLRTLAVGLFQGRSKLELSFSTKIISLMRGRKFVKTEGGFLGAASHAAETGDTVALLRGGRFPLVLRTEGSNWRVVGDCYVPGLEDGRYWEHGQSDCRDMWLE